MSKAVERISASETGGNGGVSTSLVTAPLLPSQPWAAHHNSQVPRSMAEHLTAILRFKWTLLVVFILVSSPLIAAIWTQVLPEYKASGQIRIQPIIPRLVFRTDDNGQIPFYDSFVNTQVNIIRSTTVLQRIMDNNDIQKTQWYKNRPKTLLQKWRNDQTSALERLQGGLSVKPRPNTEIVDVSFIDTSGEDARRIVDAVLAEYISYDAEASNLNRDDLNRQLRNQYDTLVQDIDGREEILTNLRKKLGTANPMALVNSRKMRLDEAEARLNALQQRLILLQWEVTQSMANDSNDSNGVGGVNVKKPAYSMDQDWRSRHLQVRNLQHQLDNNIYTKENPASVRMEKDLTFAQELLQERETQLDEQFQALQEEMKDRLNTALATDSLPVKEVEETPEYQYDLAKQEEALLAADIPRQMTEFATLFDSAQLYESENITLQHRRKLFDSVRQQMDQKKIENEVPGSIQVLTNAYTPSRPSSDRRVQLTAMALFLGLGLGGGLAFMKAGMNQVIYAASDMPLPIQTPFLGCMPVAEGKGAPDCDGNLVMLESMRAIRTSFYARLNGHACPIVMVTSATNGTGKSSLTAMLGKSMAQTGKKVLLIDADIYKRSLSRQFQVDEQPGLVESLHAKTIDKQGIYPTETYGLDIMPTGLRSDDHAAFEEIAGSAFKQVISQIIGKNTYDIVLLDGPPIMAVADATIIARQIDGVILVEREHVSHRINIADALIRLNATGGRLFGTVFVGTSKANNHGYGYREDKRQKRKQKRQAEVKARRKKWKGEKDVSKG